MASLLPRALRVLAIGSLYPPHSLGGYEVIWRGAMAHLVAEGHAVRVLATDTRFPEAEGAREEHEVRRELCWYWRDHAFPAMNALERLRIERHNARVLRAQLEEFQPDVVMWWAMGGMSLSLIEQVRRRGLPAVGMVCDDWLVYGPHVDAWTRAWARRPAWLGQIAEALTGIPTRFDPGAAATWVFISEETRRQALERGARSLPRTAIEHSGVDPARFPSRPVGAWRWRLLYLGRIDVRKGIASAIEALEHLPEVATLRVVGGGDEEHLAELRALAAERHLAQRVEFAGPAAHDTMADAYAAADLLVFPVTWPEPWGLVPIEAMAVGRPVVATGTGGSGEYLRGGENCLLFESGNAEALAAAARRLADDPALRERLLAGGRATAERFTEERFNRALERVLVDAVAR